MIILELIKNDIKIFKKLKTHKNKVTILLPEIKFIVELDITPDKTFPMSRGHIRNHQAIYFLGYDWEAVGLTKEFVNNKISGLYPLINRIFYTQWSGRECPPSP